jgi:hypothetical protein
MRRWAHTVDAPPPTQELSRLLQQQTELASRKLELEFLKLEGAQEAASAGDNFLAALGFEEGDCDGEEQA